MASPLKLRPGISPLLIPAPNPRMEALRKRVKFMPQEPGVYRWFNESGEIIYVGKAKNLKQRLRSYVTPTPRVEHFRKRALLENMADLEVTFTSTEMEALILEMHLIRSLKPRYNVSLTRDKHYVYVRIGSNETFPSVRLVHKKERDGGTYLGPYTNPWTQRKTLEMLRDIYRFRTCEMGIHLHPQSLFEEKPAALKIPLDLAFTKKDRRTPCLDYHIEKCSGPCGGDMTPERYKKECIDGVISFYKGNTAPVTDEIMRRMQSAAGDRKFERAQEMLDLLHYLNQMTMQNKIFDVNAQTIDAFGFADNLTGGSVLQVRGGSIANEERLMMEGDTQDTSSSLSQIIMQFYAGSEDIPDVIAIPTIPDELPLIADWLMHEAGRPVDVRIPKRGELHRLVRLAETNARRKEDKISAAAY
jgi:excinuclease ABC subunit C